MNAKNVLSVKSFAFLFVASIVAVGASKTDSHVRTAERAPQAVVLARAEHPSERLAAAENPSDSAVQKNGTCYARGAENPSDANTHTVA